MSEETTPAKPGTACLGCRRRKLRCSREQEGCSNCLRADLPCVYPTPEVGVKRKRGPYKKDKAPRERHLEDLVKYLEPAAGGSNSSADSSGGLHAPARGEETVTYSFRPAATDNTPICSASGSLLQSSNSEDLVKDALVALTKSSVNDVDAQAELRKHAAEVSRRPASADATIHGPHPPARRMFEYWEIYVHRIDPLMKIIHCPSFTNNLFAAIDRPREMDTHIQTLLFSVYYAAVSTCTPKEVRMRFGESKSSLQQRYGKTIEASVADHYGVPPLELVQALVLYIIAIRRIDGDVNVRALFSLAVRMAQLIGLDKDPAERYPPLEVELRRRLWWQICGLESRAAEEGVARQTSIMEGHNVEIASNLDDYDLQLDLKQAPKARSGVTGASFHVLRSEVVSLAHKLWAVKKRFKLEGRMEETVAINQEQRAALEDFRSKIRTELIAHCDTSRRFDWLLVSFFHAMSIKMHMIVEYPTGQVPTKEMSEEARLDILQSSVMVIGSTVGLEQSNKLGDWGWYFRGYMQWHSVAIVIAELGRSTNPAFANNAWAVLDPVLRSWDQTYEEKRDEPAWDHVNTLIEKARKMRKRNVARGQDQDSSTVPQRAPSAQESEPPRAGVLPPEPHSQQPAPYTWPASQDPNLSTATMLFMPNSNTPLDLYSKPASHHDPAYGHSMMPSSNGVLPALDDSFSLGDFGDLQNIDFSAFDAVFGDTTWESSPSMDFSWDGMRT